MQSIESKYSNVVALLQESGISLTAIRECTNNIPALEGKVNALEALRKEKGIDPYTQYSALVETTVLSGKLTAAEISESVAGYDNSEEKLAALKRKLKIKESKPARITRNNGATISESDRQKMDNKTRIKDVQKKFRMSEKEACIYLGLEYVPESVGDANSEKIQNQMHILRFHGFSESDSQKIIKEGWYFGN
jgi:hypothetical protein